MAILVEILTSDQLKKKTKQNTKTKSTFLRNFRKKLAEVTIIGESSFN